MDATEQMNSKQITVGHILSCLKALIETKEEHDPDEEKENLNEINRDASSLDNNIKCDGIQNKPCNCHESKNNSNIESVNEILRQKMDVFFDEADKFVLKDFIMSQGNVTSLTHCCCFEVEIKLLSGELSCSNDIIWHFVSLCLKSLLATISILEKEEDGINSKQQNNQTHKPNILGVNDQSTICAVIELVISFGIMPNLLPGIGRPMKCEGNITSLLPPKNKIFPRKLAVVSHVLIGMLKNKTLNSIIVSRYFNDVVAALIQLCNCPAKSSGGKAKDNSLCCCMKDTGPNCCENCSLLCQHEKTWYSKELESILTTTYQPVVIKELLVLQRLAIIQKKPNLKWFLRDIGNKLSNCMMACNGVKYVIEGILAGCNADSMNWQKYKSIGKLIAHVPVQVSSPSIYYSQVCPQLLKFLDKKDSMSGSQYVMITVACVEEMLELNFDLAEKHLFAPLLEPLKTCYSTFAKVVVIDIHSDEVIKSILLIKALCSSDVAMSDHFVKVLSSVLHPLYIICCLHTDRKILKPLHYILSYLLHQMDTGECIRWLKVFMFNKCLSENNSDYPALQLVSSDVYFTQIAGDTDKVNVDEIGTEVKVSTILSLLQDKKFEEIRGVFFVNLLESLTKVLNIGSKKKPKENEEEGISQELKEIDLNIEDIQNKIQLISLVSALIDTFGCEILKDTPQTVAFIKSILDLPWNNHEETSPALLDVEDDFHEQTVDLVLMLLSFLLKTDELTSSDFVILNTLCPSLDKASQKHSKESSRSLAIDLKVYIATRGAVTPESASKSEPAVDPRQVDLSSKYAYDVALKELIDPLLPTRGHALFQLSKLLRHRNKFAMKDKEKLLDIFETNLGHDDTYLYLAAIEGLLYLVDVHHKDILPLLCRRFAQFHDQNRVTLSSELRMKIGEAIVKSCRLIGNMLPLYCQLLLSALLTGVKDPDHLVRASSLSAVGDVCQLSKFNISSFSTEIVSCVHRVVSTDTSVEVRRAAVQVFTLMFKGVGPQLLHESPAKTREIYHVLKNVLVVEKDELTILHASSALDMLDDVVKDALFPKEKLEKKIQILG